MNRTRSLSTAALALFGTCFAGSAFAQTSTSRSPELNTAIALKGTVEKVRNIANRQGWYVVHLTLKSEGRAYDVHLGPAVQLSQSALSFHRGDQVEVWGSWTVATSDTIAACAIEKSGQIQNLRGASGLPVCAGRDLPDRYR